jgi:pyruvate dehydrogenase E1 component alpha subunit
MMAELFGKKTGYCQGKGGSMHIADVSLGILGANGIVGAGLPIANGAAITALMKNTDQVVLCFFGDGAANQGTFHESLNLASIWKLPVVFVCENNLYAMSTPTSYHMNISSISQRGAAYGMPGVRVEGNEVLEVYTQVHEAAARARRGEGPTLVECVTFRHLGHFVGDPEVYMAQEEKEAWMKKDPIALFRQHLLEEDVMDQKALSALEQEVTDEVEAAVEFAKNSPDPLPEEAMEHVYSNWRWGSEYR